MTSTGRLDIIVGLLAGGIAVLGLGVSLLVENEDAGLFGWITMSDQVKAGYWPSRSRFLGRRLPRRLALAAAEIALLSSLPAPFFSFIANSAGQCTSSWTVSHCA